jgi:hypothetical protein
MLDEKHSKHMKPADQTYIERALLRGEVLEVKSVNRCVRVTFSSQVVFYYHKTKIYEKVKTAKSYQPSWKCYANGKTYMTLASAIGDQELHS